ncbi:MAG: GGDEF domain-containing protein [Myxococcaceae bacterium]
MKDVLLFSKLGRRLSDVKEKSLTAYLLELSVSIAEQNHDKTAGLVREMTQSDAVLLRLKTNIFSPALSLQDQAFLKQELIPKAGQHAKLNSVLICSNITLGRAEINAFSPMDQMLLEKISKHIHEDLTRQTQYQEIVKDTVTGFWGREIFFDFLEQEFGRSRRYQAPLSLILIDIDGFSRFTQPNLILTKTAHRIKTEIRQGDFIARLAENTFALVQPMTQGQNAAESASRLLSKFKHLPILIQEIPLQIHLSMGVASLSTQDELSKSVLERADKALSAAKRLGGNQIVMFD